MHLALADRHRSAERGPRGGTPTRRGPRPRPASSRGPRRVVRPPLGTGTIEACWPAWPAPPARRLPVHGDLHVDRCSATRRPLCRGVFDGNPTVPPTFGRATPAARDLAQMLVSLENVEHVVRHYAESPAAGSCGPQASSAFVAAIAALGPRRPFRRGLVRAYSGGRSREVVYATTSSGVARAGGRRARRLDQWCDGSTCSGRPRRKPPGWPLSPPWWRRSVERASLPLRLGVPRHGVIALRQPGGRCAAPLHRIPRHRGGRVRPAAACGRQVAWSPCPPRAASARPSTPYVASRTPGSGALQSPSPTAPSSESLSLTVPMQAGERQGSCVPVVPAHTRAAAGPGGTMPPDVPGLLDQVAEASAYLLEPHLAAHGLRARSAGRYSRRRPGATAQARAAVGVDDPRSPGSGVWL
jgi:hypothetical protein